MELGWHQSAPRKVVERVEEFSGTIGDGSVVKMYLQGIGDFFSNVPKRVIREMVEECIRRVKEKDPSGIYF